jgi:hypothetical protein
VAPSLTPLPACQLGGVKSRNDETRTLVRHHIGIRGAEVTLAES